MFTPKTQLLSAILTIFLLQIALAQDIKIFTKNQLKGCKVAGSTVLRPEFTEIIVFGQWLIAQKQNLYAIYGLDGQKKKHEFAGFVFNDYFLAIAQESSWQVYDLHLQPVVNTYFPVEVISRQMMWAKPMLLTPKNRVLADWVRPGEEYVEFGTGDFVGMAEMRGEIIFPAIYRTVEGRTATPYRYFALFDTLTGIWQEGILADTILIRGDSLLAQRKKNKFGIQTGSPPAAPSVAQTPYSAFEHKGLWGIQINGKELISPLFNKIELRQHYFIFEEPQGWGTADYQGNQLFYSTLPYRSWGQLILIEKKGKFGLVGILGNLVLDVLYDSIVACRNADFLKIYSKGQFVYFWKQTQSLIQPQPYEFRPLDEPDEQGLLIWQKDNKYGVADWQGKIRIFPNYQWIGPSSAGLLPFKIKSLFGFMSIREEIIIQPSFEAVGRFYAGKAPARRNKWGFINLKGEWEIKNEFDTLIQTQNGNWITKIKDKYGFWRADFQGGLPPIYNAVYDIGKGYVVALINQKYQIFSCNGKPKNEDKFDFFSSSGRFVILGREQSQEKK